MSAPTHLGPDDDDLAEGDATVILPATLAYTGLHCSRWQPLSEYAPETRAAIVAAAIIIGLGLIAIGLIL